MYEAEVNGRTESVEQIPAAVLARFRELGSLVTARTVLPWGEHCTECVWPTCYTSCDLYAPRADGKCRRFVDGMVRLDAPDTATGYLVKIGFKQWGKLWTAGNVHLFSSAQARSMEGWDRRVGSALNQIGLRFATWRRYDQKKKQTFRRPPSETAPGHFVVECYNPNPTTIGLSLTMRPTDETKPIPFQQLIDVSPGYTRALVPIGDITRVLNLAQPFTVELIPNDVESGTTLYFGMLDFAVGVPEPAAAKVAPLKCVVWDLDNTMWSGTLVEDGAEHLTLKPGIADVIKRLDERGILHSVASKNNADEALGVLSGFGIRDYFLFPDISWGPKSEALKRIAKRLNIGIDSLLFIDDSEFELAEVRAACPTVRVMHATDYLSLPDRPEAQMKVTAEAAERRVLYQQEAVRQTAAEQFGEDYYAFLRDCRLEAHLRPMTSENLPRVHELTQRTNQMNFSGNRYERAVLERILADPHLDTYVLDCRDRFGEYGVVGFCLVDNREPRITDLMFSCRVQSKRVEHALLSRILQRYRADVPTDVFANYRKTPRNAPSGRVFEDVGFEIASETDGVSSLVFRRERPVPDDGIVTVVVHERENIAAVG
ncbi:MAG TPA: HAD-IIIC family phosphatase [Gemmatimonadaceae bacterium]|nr:HAD-IIIC family phosphatase [Gemmatimonadaceae bacterium]